MRGATYSIAIDVKVKKRPAWYIGRLLLKLWIWLGNVIARFMSTGIEVIVGSEHFKKNP